MKISQAIVVLSRISRTDDIEHTARVGRRTASIVLTEVADVRISGDVVGE
jgi:hypothetical protein